MKLTQRARMDLGSFWSWLQGREEWFYRELPTVQQVRWYYSLVGDVYTLESWTSFEDERAWGAYRRALASLKSDAQWESQRTSQEEWWEFLDTRLVVDPPVDLGFTRASGSD